MQYLKDYQEYLELGGVCDATAYARYSDRACLVIDNATFNRIHGMKDTPWQVKGLCRDLIEYFANDFGSSKQISSYSQSAGGVSESYTIRSTDEKFEEINELIKDYLSKVVDDNGTPLLYKGAMI